MVAVIHHAQPGMRAGLGDALQPLFAEGIGATADGPVVVPHLIGSQRHGIAPRIGQKPRTDAKALLGQCRVEIPRQASGRPRVQLGGSIAHSAESYRARRSFRNPISLIAAPTGVGPSQIELARRA